VADLASIDESSFFHASRRRALGSQRLRNPWLRAFRRIVWSRLPQPLRKAVLKLVFAPRRAPLAVNAPAAQPICVVGLLSTSTGIGEGGRLCGRALAALAYDVRSVDVSELLEGTDPMRDRAPLLEPGGGTVILHFNPDNLQPTLALMGRRRLRGKRIIGYWAWELPRIPDHWIGSLDHVDEVWTPSRFVAEAVRPFTAKPVRVVPHPVALGRSGTSRRRRFGIAGQFVVLTMFTFASSFPRKNPIAAVQAFRRAFGDAADRLLILKVSDAAEAPDEMRQLLAAIGDAPNIRVEERRLSEDDRLDLIASADVLLSLHRSEGFGLAMAEAMLAGILVVATGWSGNLDFMDETSALLVPARMIEAADGRGVYGYGECWAEPDVAAAAAHLSTIAANPSRFEAMRRSALAMAREKLGIENYHKLIRGALGPALRHPARSGKPEAPAKAVARTGLQPS